MLTLLSWLACRVPEPWVRPLGCALGWFIGSCLRLRRGVVVSNLRCSSLGTESRSEGLVRRIYAHLGRVLIETLRLPRLDERRAKALVGGEALAQLGALRQRGRGVLVLTGHLGHWDLLACAAARAGLPVTVVTRDIRQRQLNGWWMRVRRAHGVHFLPARDSALGILAALRRGDLVCLALDQHQPGGAVVPFFGRPAATSTALARLARATKAPVVGAFLVSDPHYRTVLRPISEADPRISLEDAVRATAQYSGIIEDLVRQYPEQWFWVHRRWKVAPI